MFFQFSKYVLLFMSFFNDLSLIIENILYCIIKNDNKHNNNNKLKGTIACATQF